MVPTFESQLMTFVVVVAIAFGLSYLISMVLGKINRKLIFALPIGLLVIAIICWIVALFDTTGWGALGFLLMGIFALLGSLGSVISSVILWKKTKPKDDFAE